MSARKVRLVADLVRGMDASAALDQLRFVVKHAKEPIEKTLRAALANAEHNFHLEKANLMIGKITVDQGASLKRWRPRAFGRAAPIAKHSCHITIVLTDKKSVEAAKGEKETKKVTKKSKAKKLAS